MKPRISAEKVVLFLIKITQSIPPGDRAAVLESVFAQCRDTPLIMAGIKICDWVLEMDIASIKKNGFDHLAERKSSCILIVSHPV